MSTSLFDFLSEDELVVLCGGLLQPAAQLRKLHSMGIVRAYRMPRGRVRLFRSIYEFWRNPPPPEPVLVVPPREEWKDTPLGRWQQKQREAEAQFRAENPPPPPPTRQELARREYERLERSAENRAALIRHHTAKRRTVKLQRIPPWADLQAIRAIYDQAQAITRETGVPHHVDHEIPLQGKLVSGLHIHNNLQILTGSENSKKHNRFEVEV